MNATSDTTVGPYVAMPVAGSPADHMCRRSARFVERIAALIIITPFLAFILACVIFWGRGIDLTQLAIFGFMYFISLFGVAAGFHRLLSHSSYRTSNPIRVLLAICGSMAAQGPVIFWVAIHRRHHRFADHEGDPHSPHLYKRDGKLSALLGFWHAHTGWMFAGDYTDWAKYAPDLVRDRSLFVVNQWYFAWVAAGLVLPAALGGLATGTWFGAFQGFLIGGLVRIFFVHHVTWCINSVCHTFGHRSFNASDHSRNNVWLSLVTLGESWHNNHHTYPASASFRMKWYEFDLCGAVIELMSVVGLTWGLKKATPRETQVRRSLED